MNRGDKLFMLAFKQSYSLLFVLRYLLERRPFLYYYFPFFFVFVLYSCSSTISFDSKDVLSPYYRNVVFNTIPNGYYEIVPSDETQFGPYSTTEEVLAAFDRLCDSFPSFLNKHIIGKSSDEQDIVSYELGSSSINAPTIVILSCQHGFEKSSVFGLYFFLKDILSTNRPDIKTFFDSIHYIIIPIANPFGFDHNCYVNKNGVNLNRNWPVIGWKSHLEKGSYYSGIEPLDQPETLTINSYLLSFPDIYLFIDFHTFGETNVTSFNNVNCIIIPQVSNDTYYYCFIRACTKSLEAVTQTIKKRNGLNYDGLLGYIYNCSYYRNEGQANNYFCQQSILSLTLEGFNGYPDGGRAFDNDIYLTNGEILGNLLINVAIEHMSFRKNNFI